MKIKEQIRFLVWRIKFHTRLKKRANKRLRAKLTPKKLLFSLSIFFIIIIITLIALYINWISAPDFLELGNTEVNKDKRETLEIHSQVSRNRGWLVWMIVSFFGLSIGLGLAIWGRIIQHRSHLHERYEKAATMLGDGVMAVRIAGCRALMSLGVDDESMKVQCVRLLFAFMNGPYLKPEDQDKKLDEIFPDDKPLRADVQEAADSFSTIYNHYGNEGIDNRQVELPDYFWKNKCKNLICLSQAYLWEKNLQEVDLRGSNLQGSKFRGANLQKAILKGVNLQGAELNFALLVEADLVEADLQGAELIAAKMRKADLTDANLQRVDFTTAQLQEVVLNGAKLQGADLFMTNFQGANFDGVNLQGVKLSRAIVTDAKMDLAENLTRKQILSAGWGIEEGKGGNPPLLPEKLANDPKVKKWRKNPVYIKVKKQKNNS